jgi:hypothetical protein
LRQRYRSYGRTLRRRPCRYGLKYKTLIPLRTPADDFAAKSMFLR